MNRFRLFLCVAQGLRTSQRFMRATVLPPYNLLAVQATIGSNNKCGQELQICRSNGNLAEPEYVVDNITYDRVCAETLDALSDYFDELTENATDLSGTDVVYGDGVLSVNLGSVNGIYVINRQKPNKQIWLSSPISGPKRFDYMLTPGQVTGRWVYKHTGETLHELLQKEIAKVFRGQPVNFSNLL